MSQTTERAFETYVEEVLLSRMAGSPAVMRIGTRSRHCSRLRYSRSFRRPSRPFGTR